MLVKIRQETKTDYTEVAQIIKSAFESDEPAIIEVNIEPNQKIEPKLGWGKPIEDQLPEMSREFFSKYMIIKEFTDTQVHRDEIN